MIHTGFLLTVQTTSTCIVNAFEEEDDDDTEIGLQTRETAVTNGCSRR